MRGNLKLVWNLPTSIKIFRGALHFTCRKNLIAITTAFPCIKWTLFSIMSDESINTMWTKKRTKRYRTMNFIRWGRWMSIYNSRKLNEKQCKKFGCHEGAFCIKKDAQLSVFSLPSIAVSHSFGDLQLKLFFVFSRSQPREASNTPSYVDRESNFRKWPFTQQFDRLTNFHGLLYFRSL